MKSYKLSLAMIAIVLSITSVFAFRPVPTNPHNTTYYWFAVRAGSSWNWQNSQPAGTNCVSGSATCEISTTIAGTPPAGGFPSSYTALAGSDKHSVLAAN